MKTNSVSILIVTYNSSRWIADTLDSCLQQTYDKQEIELVISDDSSTDNTLELIQLWAEKHRKDFYDIKVAKTEKNIGIVGNYNQALSLSTGYWIKTLDGDDMLTEGCIEKNVLAAHRCDKVNVWLSGWERIDERGNTISREGLDFPMTTAQKQLRRYLLYIEDLHSNTLFIKRDTLIKVGGFDKRYKMTQDIPLVYNLLSSGETFGIIEEEITVRFRQVSDSVSRSSNATLREDVARCRYENSKYYLRYGLIMHRYEALVTWYIHRYSHRGYIHKLIGYILRIPDVVNHYYKWSKKRRNQ